MTNPPDPKARELIAQWRTLLHVTLVNPGARPLLYCADDMCAELESALARIERLEGAIRSAVATANGRWDEWGARAEMVADILDDALGGDDNG